MTQRQSRRQSTSDSRTERSTGRTRREPPRAVRETNNRRQHHEERHPEPVNTSLTRLIERDAPLQNHTGLVLMYGPFQAEMVPEQGQGVASWLKDCVRKHGIPSLLRFDYGRRAQVFRRDQFQPWLEPLMSQLSS